MDDDELDEEERDAVGLGEDRDAWRDIPGRADDSHAGSDEQGRKGKGKVGVHQGLTNV